jgi:hypothetical protein
VIAAAQSTERQSSIGQPNPVVVGGPLRNASGVVILAKMSPHG